MKGVDELDRFIVYIQNIRFRDVIDIIIVAYVFYKFITLIRETRAEQLLKGIIALALFGTIINVLNLYTMKWILDRFFVYGILVLLIVFQPELRKALEVIGRNNFFSKPLVQIQDEEIHKQTEEIVSAVFSMARQNIGALIVIERKTGISDIIESGTRLEAITSSELLINIFYPNSPLHDGATIIRGDKIVAAGCFLPLTDNANLSKELGTRHRAGLGISETTDAVAIIVSEESGAVSITEAGEITRYVDENTLRNFLTNLLYKEDRGIFSLISSDDIDLEEGEVDE